MNMLERFVQILRCLGGYNLSTLENLRPAKLLGFSNGQLPCLYALPMQMICLAVAATIDITLVGFQFCFGAH